MSNLPPPGQEVIADLLEAATTEGLWGLDACTPGPAPTWVPETLRTVHDRWVRVDLPGGGSLTWAAVDGGPLTHSRYAGGQVWYYSDGGSVRPVGPDQMLELLVATDPAGPTGHLETTLAELRTAVVHAHVVRAGRARMPDPLPSAGRGSAGQMLLGGEMLAATRGRPFHPTARAVSGWTDRDLVRFGPTASGPVELAWVGVREDHVRRGPHAGPDELIDLVLDADGAARIRTLLAERDADRHRALPVHPYDLEHVLPAVFADELAEGVIVPLGPAGHGVPTASLRTLALPGEPLRHLKLPLGVSTLGAARLLPPRHLDHGDRAAGVIGTVLGADPRLAARVGIVDESDWAGFALPDGSDEFDDRPGHLAAQVRHYPDFGDGIPLPLAALGAHEWDVLGPPLGVTDVATARRFLRALTTDVLSVAFGFLGHGLLPEMHGQNVVGEFESVAGGPTRLRRLVLRDHDTLRVYRPWARAAGTPGPGYRIAPGVRQSLLLDSPEELVGYLQTLVVQVSLRAIAVALDRHFDLPESQWWATLGDAVTDAIAVAEPPDEIRASITDLMLERPTWPARAVLGPLLERGPSSGVSMPAGVVAITNPLRLRVAT
ncbi:IucA/IucC family siderophore biosynthesis protein [Pseudonocardia sp. EC080610-09]|uniref:IucA/IucC family siderophore biosynthesis protein n=1 Tax=Pseudonocardia sp. EC080610-09 TaxID=1688404 RepID=UPI000AC4B484|nr:IucA/IucC family protein [Pseudonocardia sp. EC080610-09]